MTEILQLNWPQYREAIEKIRHDVFIDEQNVPAELEWDHLDPGATHFLILDTSNPNTPDKDTPIAYARLLPEGKLTRMAVARKMRHKGFGKQLVLKALEKCQQVELTEIHLDAQIAAIEFYRKLGFIEVGDEFMDAGIKHIHMTRSTKLLINE